MDEEAIRTLALAVTVGCVRNTVIERYHQEGKLSDPEMKAFNKEVANKLYTFLTYMLDKPREEHDALLKVLLPLRPHNWDPPELDPGFVKAAERTQVADRNSGKPKRPK